MPLYDLPGQRAEVIVHGPGGSQFKYSGVVSSICHDSNDYDMSYSGPIPLGGSVPLGGPDRMEIILDRSFVPADVRLMKKGKKGKSRSKFVQEMNMERFTVTAVRNPRTRTVSVYVEDKDGKFLDSSLNRHERNLGEEGPRYTELPEEIYNAIRSSTVSDDL